jgi:hypothetical protein
MNKTEERFISLIRSNKLRSFLAAHKLLDTKQISNTLIIAAGKELVIRSQYLYDKGQETEANNALQFAYQLVGFLAMN